MLKSTDLVLGFIIEDYCLLQSSWCLPSCREAEESKLLKRHVDCQEQLGYFITVL